MTATNILEALDQALATGDEIREVVSSFFGLARSADESQLGDMLASLDQRIRMHPIERIGQVAMLAGALVEIGADTSRFPAAVFEHLLAQLESIEGPEDERELPEAYYLVERAAMACLSRSAELRKTLPQKPAMLAKLQRYDERYGFLGKMIQVLDDEPIVALHLATKRGFHCTMRGIADNFQLHVLLLAALAKHGVRFDAPSAEALAAASDSAEASNASVGSSWQLANWFGLRPDGTLAGMDGSDSWIWNEGVPAEIAAFDGTRIVLIGPTSMQRSWNAQRIFPGMVGELANVHELPAAAVQSLMQTIHERAKKGPT